MTFLRIALAVLAFAFVATTAPAYAQDEPKRPTKPKTRKVKPLSKQTYKLLTAAHEALGNDDYATALGHMNTLKGRLDKLNNNEQAQLWQTLGYIYSGKEQYKSAATAFEKALATQALSPAAETNLRYNVAQLYLATERYNKAIQTLEQWFGEAENPRADAYFLMAQAYVQIEQMKTALDWAERGLAKMEKPRESWLSLTLALNFEAKRFKRVVSLLETLVSYFPKKEYWVQLAAAYGETNQELKSLAALELAYRQGYLEKPSELRRLAQLHLYHEAPYKAARMLAAEIERGRIKPDGEDWELLANSWISAREYDAALDPLAKAAASSDDGELYVRLAQIRIEREEWNSCISSLGKALKKGGLKHRGDAYLLRGICQVNAENFDAARGAFQRARKHDDTAEAAGQWLAHVSAREAEAALDAE